MNMQLTNQSIMTPGEHAFVFEGLSGSLQGRLLVPNIPLQSFIAILGHPHSLQGGTMNNKVVTTMARAFATVGIASLRFNFRGVEGSEGIFDNGPAESDDMLVLARLWSSLHPDARMIFAGFSFGSYVTYRAAAQWPHELLISIAPPLNVMIMLLFLRIPLLGILSWVMLMRSSMWQVYWLFLQNLNPLFHSIFFRKQDIFFMVS